MSEPSGKLSREPITRPLFDKDGPSAPVPVSTSHGPSVKKRLLSKFWDRLKLESSALEALSALLAMIAIVSGVITYIGEEPQRRQASHNTAWLVINSASGLKVSGGRISALQELNKDRVSLVGLAARDANLSEIKLPYAILTRADLQDAFLYKSDLHGAFLFEANLEGAYLEEVNLEDAFMFITNLKGAHLDGANLKRADLKHANLQETSLGGANLTDADLEGADFRNSRGVTTGQVKRARNWELALYSETFREELGLPPSQPTP